MLDGRHLHFHVVRVSVYPIARTSFTPYLCGSQLGDHLPALLGKSHMGRLGGSDKIM
jgi:hypothetical protein